MISSLVTNADTICSEKYCLCQFRLTAFSSDCYPPSFVCCWWWSINGGDFLCANCGAYEKRNTLTQGHEAGFLSLLWAQNARSRNPRQQFASLGNTAEKKTDVRCKPYSFLPNILRNRHILCLSMYFCGTLRLECEVISCEELIHFLPNLLAQVLSIGPYCWPAVNYFIWLLVVACVSFKR